MKLQMITSIDENTALVIIDLQKGIVKNHLAHPVTGVLDNTRLLVAAFRKAGLPVVWVTVDPIGAPWTKSRVEIRALPKKQYLQNLIRLVMRLVGYSIVVPALEVKENDIKIRKSNWSAFSGTSLEKELRKEDITGIVLCGIATSIGVEGTARNAAELGFNLTFAVDAMTDRYASAHSNSVNNIFPRLGETGETMEIIARLQKTFTE